MFERRLKIFLGILLVFVLVLIARAAQLQIIEREYWREQAAASMRRERLIDTTRGRILDWKGAVLARDEPCIDACVDYRAIVDPPNAQWVRDLAIRRLREHHGDEYRAASLTQRRKMIRDETDLILNQIQRMWQKLGEISGKTPTEMEELRRSIRDRIDLRRRVVLYHNYRKAVADSESKPEVPWYRKWILGDQSEAPDIDDIPIEPLEEERSPHVIIEAIDITTQNELLKHAEIYPGLSLQPSTHRVYPYGQIACHVIGRIGKVYREDLASDPEFDNEMRKYHPNDIKGRAGLESLGEPTLRGTRGMQVFDGTTSRMLSSTPPIPGQDLRTTLDIDLQMQIEELFTRVKIPYDTSDRNWRSWKYDEVSMHGAAVVIDIDTGEVRALVSAPGYDLNLFDKQYALLSKDRLNTPLLNRATQSMFEPGSTVKPIVGLGAITQGVIGVSQGIECTGFLTIGNTRYRGFGKCWTVNTARSIGWNDSAANHHPFPEPHLGQFGNPNGFLTFADALERSCNVYFETVADKLKIEGLSYWMERFGLGRPTGIGIAEVRGRLPRSYDGPAAQRDYVTWAAGMGQGQISATPLQMANVAATIARRGVWVRPSLVQSGQRTAPFKPRSAGTEDTEWDEIPSRMDLKLSPAAIEAAQEGMRRVVNGAAGTGTTAFRKDMIVAGKTGTAQAARFVVPTVNQNGEKVMVKLRPSTHENPNPEHPWYRAIDKEGQRLNHAWFIGYVPADRPRFAVSVMVEYGGGGGGAVAGPIVEQIIEALVEHGYLRKGSSN